MAGCPQDQTAAAAAAARVNKANMAKRTAARTTKQAEEAAIPTNALAMAASINTSLNSITTNLLRDASPVPDYHAIAKHATKKAVKEAVRYIEVGEIKMQFQGCGYQNKLTEKQVKEATLTGTIPTAIVNSGASPTCVKTDKEQNQVSECGHYKWKGLPYQKTGEKSDKLFVMALSHVALGTDVVDPDLPLRKEAREGHTVKGMQNNIYSVSKLVQAD